LCGKGNILSKNSQLFENQNTNCGRSDFPGDSLEGTGRAILGALDERKGLLDINFAAEIMQGKEKVVNLTVKGPESFGPATCPSSPNDCFLSYR
jgi:hypothetical protein